jgi:hypothetical protein
MEARPGHQHAAAIGIQADIGFARLADAIEFDLALARRNAFLGDIVAREDLLPDTARDLVAAIDGRRVPWLAKTAGRAPLVLSPHRGAHGQDWCRSTSC